MPIATRLSELFLPGFELPEFKPFCWYIKELDWFIYLARDCTYVATRTQNPHVELLKDGDEVVGIKILWFSELAWQVRQDILDWTRMSPDDIKGAGDIILNNVRELLPQIFAEQAVFFDELRQRFASGELA